MQLDDHLKQLLRELGHAINDTVSESGRISEAISDVRSAGFDIVLKLDATIGLARRDGDDTKITTGDRRFLESLHIQVDQEILNETTEDEEPRKMEMTPQDLRFLKSLKIQRGRKGGGGAAAVRVAALPRRSERAVLHISNRLVKNFFGRNAFASIFLRGSDLK